jgi:hypothetical protein
VFYLVSLLVVGGSDAMSAAVENMALLDESASSRPGQALESGNNNNISNHHAASNSMSSSKSPSNRSLGKAVTRGLAKAVTLENRQPPPELSDNIFESIRVVLSSMIMSPSSPCHSFSNNNNLDGSSTHSRNRTPSNRTSVTVPTTPTTHSTKKKHQASGMCSSTTSNKSASSSFFQEVAKPFTTCATEMSSSHRRRNCYDLDYDGDLSLFNSEEEDLMQMRRLTSWSTNGTFGTQQSDLDSDSPPFVAPFDDDGMPIDPKILEKTIETREKRAGVKKRVVKFEYPPVSALRQCPRPDPQDLPQLYFTEEELDQIEDDRESTFTADDVEVVAVSSSLSEDIDVVPSIHSPSDERNFEGYVATPRKGRNRKRNFGFEEQQAAAQQQQQQPAGSERESREGRSASPLVGGDETTTDSGWKPTRSPTPTSREHRSHRKNRDPRLIKSVQIYLRERSTGL